MSVKLYGVMAEFSTPEALLAAARAAAAAGHGRIEAYTPFSVEGLADAIGFTRTRLPLLTLLGGIAGGAGGYFLQWYTAVFDYPVNAGGRPLNAWPAFVPGIFELTILGAALASFFGFLILNGLPALYHPVFNAPDFDLATRNRFFLCLRATGADFDAIVAQDWLRTLSPIRVFDVDE
jgi:hypothetical protein